MGRQKKAEAAKRQVGLDLEVLLGYLMDSVVIGYHLQRIAKLDVPAVDRHQTELSVAIGRIYGLKGGDWRTVRDAAYDVFCCTAAMGSAIATRIA